jgi:nucleoside-diphosphate-sugar epimerase
MDRQAIETMGAALEGTDRPLVIASGVATTAEGRPATENDPPAPDFPRSQAATMTLAMAGSGVRPSVVRLPPTTHGRGDTGFIPRIIETARERGAAGYIGDGTNVWPAVHRSDAARVFRLATEQASPAGSVWHAVGEEGIPTRTIAEVIGRHLHIPVVSIARENAFDHFGWIGAFWASNVPTSSSITRERLGWQPTGPGLLQDLEEGDYFQSDWVRSG